jgi:hypothetical protein
MRYLRVTWRHDLPNEPVELYSELDDDSWEIRKVEIFRDGRIGFADSLHGSETTRLAIEPDPSLEQIAQDPQFVPRAITRQEFEAVWEQASGPVLSDHHGDRS